FLNFCATDNFRLRANGAVHLPAPRENQGFVGIERRQLMRPYAALINMLFVRGACEACSASEIPVSAAHALVVRLSLARACGVVLKQPFAAELREIFARFII